MTSVCARVSPAGVFRIREVRRQQPGLLHDTEQELHHELVKERPVWSRVGTQQGLWDGSESIECMRTNANVSPPSSGRSPHSSGRHAPKTRTHARTHITPSMHTHAHAHKSPPPTHTHTHRLSQSLNPFQSLCFYQGPPGDTAPSRGKKKKKKLNKHKQASNVNTINYL